MCFTEGRQQALDLEKCKKAWRFVFNFIMGAVWSGLGLTLCKELQCRHARYLQAYSSRSEFPIRD